MNIGTKGRFDYTFFVHHASLRQAQYKLSPQHDKRFALINYRAVTLRPSKGEFNSTKTSRSSCFEYLSMTKALPYASRAYQARTPDLYPIVTRSIYFRKSNKIPVRRLTTVKSYFFKLSN